MDAAAAAAQLYGMLQMQHFVIDDVLDGVTRHALVVEGTAESRALSKLAVFSYRNR